MSKRFDIKDVSAAALGAYPGLLQQWLPGGRMDGQEYKAADLNGGRGDSLSVNVRTGLWCDFATGDKGGDPVSLYAAVYRVSQLEAAKQVAGILGYDVDAGQAPERPTHSRPAAAETADKWTQELPPEAPREIKHSKLGKPAIVWAYRTQDGQVIGYVCRFNTADGGKEVLPYSYGRDGAGKAGWRWKSFDTPRPLYGLETLAGNGQVFVCEGEKATDACRRLLGVTAVSWPGGSKAIDKVDWQPLAGRSVVLWPDADEPGMKAMQAIATRLHALGCTVKVIDTSDQSDGWDAADAESDGWTREQTLAWGKARISVWSAPPTMVGSEKSSRAAVAPAVMDVPAAPSPQPAADRKSIRQGLPSWGRTRRINRTPVDESVEYTPNQPAADEPPPITDEYVASVLSREDFDEPPPELDDNPDKFKPFEILGYNRNVYYYLPRNTMQVLELTPASHTKNNLIALAPLSYWESQYPKKNGFDIDMAINALMHRAAQVGIFSSDRIRGRGAWVDKQRAVVNLGSDVYVDGKLCRPVDVDSKYLYEAGEPLPLTFEQPATTEEAHRLVRICERLTWESPVSAQLLAGWCVIAPVCGALEWRSHIWVTGPASAGKSTVMNRIIKSVVGPVGIFVEGNTTEPGLRQTIGHDARPVIYDEAESEDRNRAQAMQAVLSLARISSSGGEVVKGSQDGDAKRYSARSCFCFSSINTAIAHHADETRISKLVLRRNEAPDREVHYKELTRDISQWLTPEYAAKMFARSVAHITTLLANIRTFTDALDSILGNRRAADQIGPMLAGLYLCHSTNRITFDKAVDWIRERHWGEHAALDGSNDERKLLTVLMMKRARLPLSDGRTRDLTFGELVLHVAGSQNIIGLDRDEAANELGRNAIKVEKDKGRFIISNSAPPISAILENTPWAKDWRRPLRALPGAEPTDPTRFAPGMNHRGTAIPIALLEGE
jgi:putative DNA primase/helicase